jgi:glycosyltransferase involved in cell wall biosynthesis
MRVDQWLPAAHYGDAIGDESLRIREVLRRAGYLSEIYALDVDEEVKAEFLPFDGQPGLPDLTIYHFALPSALTEAFRRLRSRKLIIYHNITPAKYFLGLDDELVRIAVKGRQELASLAGVAELALGDSEFNRRELESMGFRRTGVFPILMSFDRYRGKPSPVLFNMLNDGRANFLFVGRIYPNKHLEDLLRLAFFYKKYVSENFRFLLVGRAGRMVRYQQAVQGLAHRWGLRSSEFVFTGHLPWDDLLACYRGADLFVSMSEHEGFAVPLVEAMLAEVPVMAYAAGAVPDTLGEAGVVFHEKKYAELAEMAYSLMSEPGLRTAVVASQNRRLERFRPERLEAELLAYVEEVCR